MLIPIDFDIELHYVIQNTIPSLGQRINHSDESDPANRQATLEQNIHENFPGKITNGNKKCQALSTNIDKWLDLCSWKRAKYMCYFRAVMWFGNDNFTHIFQDSFFDIVSSVRISQC